MPFVFDATVAGPTANSYETLAEAEVYFDSRIDLSPSWEDTEDDKKEKLLVTSTRQMDAMFRGQKVLIPGDPCKGCSSYMVRRSWTGRPTTTTQKLAWPRTGMYDQNGNAIDPMTIPQDLKDAVSEFAGQLNAVDRTLDNQVSVLGITEAHAGSVGASFKNGYIDPKVLPDAVVNLLPPSWYVEETFEPGQPAIFEVIEVVPTSVNRRGRVSGFD